MKRFILIFFTVASFALPHVEAGYEQPCYIDGCRSMGGRFEVTAKLIERGKTSHGPNKWHFIWKDLTSGETKEFPALGIQGGQIYGQLYIAPDGETFALWNHITMYWKEKSHMHASGHKDVLKRGKVDEQAFRTQDIFKNRLIIYRKDGTIIKQMAINDFLRSDDEWKSVLPVFNRTHWLQPYENINFKASPRKAYAYTKVSPDYTVIELMVGNRKSPRIVRVSLIDGSIFPDDHTFEHKNKVPVRCFLGDEHIPKNGGEWLEAYTPALDPVREPGTYRIDPIDVAFPKDKAPKKTPDFQFGKVELIAEGFTKADTPTWLEKFGKKPEEAGRLLFTDLEKATQYTLLPDNEVKVMRQGVTRGRMMPDGRTFIGLLDGKIAMWQPTGKGDPQVILAKGHEGRDVSLNDLTVSSRGLIYVTTLKDPEKGRLSMLDPETGKVTVLFDGENEPTLANPNGIALSRHERFLYVGISNYKNRKHSGIYAFPIKSDGTIDVAADKGNPRIAIKAPDGIATDRHGNIYFTAGNTVHVYSPYAQPLAKIKIPKGSGTNLCFGGSDRFKSTLYITTWNALYAVTTNPGG